MQNPNQSDGQWTAPPPPDDSPFSKDTRDFNAAEIRSSSNKALVYGILSIFCCPPIFAYLAFTTSQEVLANIEIYQVAEDRRGFAQAAKVLAIVGIVLWVLGLIARVALRA
jgi:hypothetical protein